MQIVDEAVERYLHQLVAPDDPVHAEMEERAHASQFPIIGPLVGSLCRQIALTISARDIFEMGSGFGYSTWWFAQGVGDGGRVVHTDNDPRRSADAHGYLERAGFGGRVTYEVGDAIVTLKKYPGPFDIIFIDINKYDYPEALELARARVRVGGYIITDNVLWSGKVTQPSKEDADTQAIVRYNKAAFASPDLLTTIVPLRDGVALSLKLSPGDKKRR